MEMTIGQQTELRSLEGERDRLIRGLTKAGKEDGAEIAYANAVQRIVNFRKALGEAGLMGVRRDKHRIGVST
jgi:hypothetical protein